jgi:tetratricopeptide (TPR) repeat protein
MESKRSLTLQELGELAIFLFDEGAMYYEQRNLSYAKTRFAQSLSVFEQLRMPNYAWIASLLFHLGKISLNEQQIELALAFFKSAAQVQQHADNDESGANLLQQMGNAATQLNNYSLARQWFEQSRRICTSLGLDEQARQLQKQAEQAFRLQDSYAHRSPQDDNIHPHEFVIRVNGQPTKKFSVSVSGETQWSILVRTADQPIALGLTGWEVVCKNV